jgi:hypothetical protein
MTMNDHTGQGDTRAVLSALIDREPVDADQLALVLEDSEARALLVDFVRLRQTLAADEDELASFAPPAHASPLRVRRVLRPLAAALLLSAAGAGGVWLGERREQERPPTPSRVIAYTPGVDWNPRQP